MRREGLKGELLFGASSSRRLGGSARPFPCGNIVQEGVVTNQAHTRPPAVAGTFYQGDPERLGGEIAAMLAESRPGLHPAPIRQDQIHRGHDG